MAQTIGYDDVVGMLRAAMENVRENHKLLSKLDSATGDGDHGTTMVRAAGAVEKAIDAADGTSLKTLLSGVAWEVMGADGGSTGPLFGSLFLGMSEAAGDNPALDCPTVAGMFEAALAKVQKQTRAQVGDKTLIDALVPAVDAIRAAADAGGTIDVALSQAAGAATQGAEATAEMQAKFGRARNLGPRTVGHVDPGATSVSLLFQGFASAIETK